MAAGLVSACKCSRVCMKPQPLAPPLFVDAAGRLSDAPLAIAIGPGADAGFATDVCGGAGPSHGQSLVDALIAVGGRNLACALIESARNWVSVARLQTLRFRA